MKKFSIRVHTGVWATLGVLAAAHGVSRCYLFNYMLWLDEQGDFFVKTLNRGIAYLSKIFLDFLSQKIESILWLILK